MSLPTANQHIWEQRNENFNKWTGLRLEITKYCQENNISENDFRFLGIYEWIEKLSEIVKCETAYLFLEESKQRAKYWIAECNSSVVSRIIDVNPNDYYITNKKFDWLITENHHDIVQFIGEGLDIDIIKSVCTK